MVEYYILCCFAIILRIKNELSLERLIPMDSSENNVKNQEDVVVEGTQDAALQACQTELQHSKERFVQLNADFANFKRRMEKDQVQWAHMAQVRVITKLLSIVDNFERAMTEKPVGSDEKAAAWVAGIQMIYTDFTKLLTSLDVKEISVEGNFDPVMHEALMNVVSDKHQSGDIVAVLEKGYRMGDTILRPAKVSVAQ